MKKFKPISFKTAFWIVIALHVLVYVGMVQLSTLRYRLSKAKWNEQMAKRSQMPSGDLWPDPNLRNKKVVAMPPVQKPKELKPAVSQTTTIPQVIIPLKPVDTKPKISYTTSNYVKTTTPTSAKSPVTVGNKVIYKRQVNLTEKAEQVITEFTQLISSNTVIQ